jgi:sugar phosphate isomerase/epimerase
VRAHQNRISWFGEEVLNARVEIGDDGVEIGQVEHKACEDLRSGWALTPERFTAHNLKVMGSNPIRNQTSSPTPIRLHG